MERGEQVLSNEPLAMKNDEGETEIMNQHFPPVKNPKKESEVACEKSRTTPRERGGATKMR
jgi:hypothetical protein